MGVCYKSPAAEDVEINALFSVMHQASRSKGGALIIGDFNFPGINWKTYESDNHGAAFLNVILDSYLVQHVMEPTWEKNILDLVLSTNEHMVEKIEIIEHLGNSDHNTICWNLIC